SQHSGVSLDSRTAPRGFGSTACARKWPVVAERVADLCDNRWPRVRAAAAVRKLSHPWRIDYRLTEFRRRASSVLPRPNPEFAMETPLQLSFVNLDPSDAAEQQI